MNHSSYPFDDNSFDPVNDPANGLANSQGSSHDSGPNNKSASDFSEQQMSNGMNMKAIFSLILAILAFSLGVFNYGFVLFTGIPAIIFGILARKEITHNPTQGGGKYALTGIIIGAVTTGVSIMYFMIQLLTYIVEVKLHTR